MPPQPATTRFCSTRAVQLEAVGRLSGQAAVPNGCPELAGFRVSGFGFRDENLGLVATSATEAGGKPEYCFKASDSVASPSLTKHPLPCRDALSPELSGPVTIL